MNILEDLWYGNVSPCEMDFKRGSKYSELLSYIVRHEEDLQKRLNDEGKEILEKFAECTNEMYGIAEREAFVRGFTLGARIIIDIKWPVRTITFSRTDRTAIGHAITKSYNVTVCL